jgi:hypothetical protein
LPVWARRKQSPDWEDSLQSRRANGLLPKIPDDFEAANDYVARFVSSLTEALDFDPEVSWLVVLFGVKIMARKKWQGGGDIQVIEKLK